jgi:radical SAM protein with 4Fe4S-binding SPASM domain
MQSDGFVSVALSFMQEVNKTAQTAEPVVLCAVLKEVVDLIVDGRLDRLALWTLVQWVQQVAFGRSESMCLGSPCGAGRSLLTVFPSGEIGPCDSIFDPTFYAPSLSQYLADLEAGGPLTHLLARRVTTVEPCVDCDVRSHCNGTCPGNVILEKGELTGVAAHECAFQYAWIKELMWLLADARIAERLLSYCSRHIEWRRHQSVTDFGD